MIPLDLVILTGFCFGVGLYWLLDGRPLRIVFGLTLISNAINLYLLSTSGDPEGKGDPIVGASFATSSVDPLPQALILTAIVIGFGITAYLVTGLVSIPRDDDEDQEGSS